MHLTAILGTEPIVDAEEEAFVVFSQEIPSQSLGFIDAHASTLEISVAGYDLTIHQSPGLLNSTRKEGTTGAVVWTITPLLSTWLSSPTNFLFTTSLLSPTSTILELGAGVSGIVALSLAPKVARYTATDQDYVLKLLRQNVSENLDVVFPKVRGKGKKFGSVGGNANAERIRTETLDWETSDVSATSAVDLIIASDCIYNESLIEPLNSTCAALCRLRGEGDEPTIVLVAQQLRSPDVFEAWLKSFVDKFWCWQVPDKLVGEGLREGSGFVVHVGVVR